MPLDIPALTARSAAIHREQRERNRRNRSLRHGGFPKAAQSHPSVVYFVQVEDGPIKIGTTTNLPGRLDELQVAQPQRLDLLAVVPGGRAEESGLHKLFEADRIRGEWFRPTATLLAHVAVAKAQQAGPHRETCLRMLRGLDPSDARAMRDVLARMDEARGF